MYCKYRGKIKTMLLEHITGELNFMEQLNRCFPTLPQVVLFPKWNILQWFCWLVSDIACSYFLNLIGLSLQSLCNAYTGVGSGGAGGTNEPQKLLTWWKSVQSLTICVFFEKMVLQKWNPQSNWKRCFFLESCFYLIHFGQVNGIFGKFGRHLGKNAKMVLDLCFDFRGHFLWSFFSGKFGEIWAKILLTPQYFVCYSTYQLIWNKATWLCTKGP